MLLDTWTPRILYSLRGIKTVQSSPEDGNDSYSSSRSSKVEAYHAKREARASFRSFSDTYGLRQFRFWVLRFRSAAVLRQHCRALALVGNI